MPPRQLAPVNIPLPSALHLCQRLISCSFLPFRVRFPLSALWPLAHHLAQINFYKMTVTLLRRRWKAFVDRR